MNNLKRHFFRRHTVPPVNTFIGAVGATSVTSPADLAAKLSIVSGRIHNFSIDANNNVSCYIGRDYTMNASAFSLNNVIIKF